LKRLPDSSYKNVLSRHNVEPNGYRPVTMPSTPTKTTEKYSMLSKDGTTVEGATNMFSSLKFGTPTKTNTPSPVAFSKPSPPPASKIKTPKSSHRTPPHIPHAVGRQLFVGTDFGDGTREMPWIVPINPEYPERNVAVFLCSP
jgi:hypothetical protein